ncbi:hypothetical protein LCGC14_0535670 [marine sediment metagenome]|uniref:Uncharacterized protein n=1 Tax=marine sediment metagenome TaxID=412755 RepID=A0A0F9V2I9_9ZZZZ
MNKTQIEWALNPDGTPGYTWNPITGCLNGCEYCYARKLANTRLFKRYLDERGILAPEWDGDISSQIDPFYPRFWEDRLLDLKTKKPGRHIFHKPRGIFVCDMSDLFGIGVPTEWTGKVMDTIKECPQHRFYLLTKQPQNLIKFSPFPDNCYVGITATDAQSCLSGLRGLEEVGAHVKFISFEPLLGHIGGLWLEDWLKSGTGISWVILGSQTKPTAMPKIEWVQEIVEAADKVGVKVFLKHNLYPLILKEGWANDIFWRPQPNRLLDSELRQEIPNTH